MRRLNDEVVFEFNRLSGFVRRDHAFVHLFAGADSDDFGFAFGRDGTGDVHDGCAWNFGDEDFSAFHLFKGKGHEIDGLLKRDDEPRHGWVGDWKCPGMSLLLKEWNHTTIAAQDVSVADDCESSSIFSGQRVAGDEQFVATQFGRAV